MKKKFTHFRPIIYSRHPTHGVLREYLPLMPFRSIIRLGSQTTKDDGRQRVELNTPEAVANSADKGRMKECFTRMDVVTADWRGFNDDTFWLFNGSSYDPAGQLEFPIVAKHRHGSRGTGNYLLSSQEEFNTWGRGKTLSNYIFEKFHDYVREYRLHVTEEGCLYACRKLLLNDTPENQRWYRNDSNSTWILEENPSFDKPVNWKAIEAECVKALKAVGLDFGACDVKVQGAETSKGKKRKDPKFFVIEINSAPSFGEITAERYIEMLPRLLQRKWKKLQQNIK